jgi:DNA-binding transcriptional LysR family regulator
MSMRFDLFDLTLFVRIAETRSLAKAAALSNISPPSVSARVKNLEDGLGVKLLHRATNGVSLTTPGEIFMRHARTMLQQAQSLHNDLHDYLGGERGCMRILANTSAISEFVPFLLRRYRTDHPDVDIDLREHLTCEIADSIGRGEADIGLVVGALGEGAARVLPYRDDLVLAARVGHPLAARQTVAFADTLDHDYVLLSGASIISSCLRRKADELKRPLKLRIEAGNFETACRMVENDMGITILPHSSAKRHARSMDIRILPLTDEWAVRHLQLFLRGEPQSMPQYVRQFVQFLDSPYQSETPVHSVKA